MQDVLIRGMSVGSIFKLVGVGLTFSLLPFMVFMGCGAAMGLNTISWNNEPITGLTALIAAPFMGAFMVVIFTVFLGTAVAFGLWIYSMLGPYEIAYRPVVEEQSES